MSSSVNLKCARYSFDRSDAFPRRVSYNVNYPKQLSPLLLVTHDFPTRADIALYDLGSSERGEIVSVSVGDVVRLINEDTSIKTETNEMLLYVEKLDDDAFSYLEEGFKGYGEIHGTCCYVSPSCVTFLKPFRPVDAGAMSEAALRNAVLKGVLNIKTSDEKKYKARRFKANSTEISYQETAADKENYINKMLLFPGSFLIKRINEREFVLIESGNTCWYIKAPNEKIATLWLRHLASFTTNFSEVEGNTKKS